MYVLPSLFVLALVSSFSNAQTTDCGDCVALVAELTADMTTHDQAIVQFLHNNFCMEQDFTEEECRMVAGHYPEMLDVIIIYGMSPLQICINEGICKKNNNNPFSSSFSPRAVTCGQCTELMQHINRHLVQDISNFVRMLHSPLYCANPDNTLPNCDLIVDVYFPLMHVDVVQRFFHPQQYCVQAGMCEQEGTTPEE